VKEISLTDLEKGRGRDLLGRRLGDTRVLADIFSRDTVNGETRLCRAEKQRFLRRSLVDDIIVFDSGAALADDKNNAKR